METGDRRRSKEQRSARSEKTLRYLEMLKGQVTQLLLLGMREPFVQGRRRRNAAGKKSKRLEKNNAGVDVLIVGSVESDGTIKDADESRSNTPFFIYNSCSAIPTWRWRPDNAQAPEVRSVAPSS